MFDRNYSFIYYKYIFNLHLSLQLNNTNTLGEFLQ